MIIFLSPALFAQSVEIGFKGGSTFSTVQFEPKIDQDPMLKYHGGFGIRFLNAKKVGIQFEANYAQRGFRQNIDSINYTGRDYTYLELPFMSHIQIGKSKTKYYIHMGSHIAYALNAQVSKMDDGVKSSEPYPLLPNRDNRWDYGLAFGFGVGYDLGPGKLQAEGRYMYSFGNIQQSLLVTRISHPRNMQFSLGYFVGLNDLFKQQNKTKRKDKPSEEETESNE
jgi:hypothetical protein